jgi:hypothetical protein
LELARWWTYHRIMMRGSESAEHADELAVSWLRFQTGRFEPLPAEVVSGRLNPRPLSAS